MNTLYVEVDMSVANASKRKKTYESGFFVINFNIFYSSFASFMPIPGLQELSDLQNEYSSSIESQLKTLLLRLLSFLEKI